jgi:hypothetical protein
MCRIFAERTDESLDDAERVFPVDVREETTLDRNMTSSGRSPSRERQPATAWLWTVGSSIRIGTWNTGRPQSA